VSAVPDSPFRPVPRRRAFEDVIVQVEQAIAEGRIGPGDRLPPERVLATQLQVSRASVREALRVLEAFGVLSSRQGRGADAGSTVTQGDQNGLAGLLRIYTLLMKVPLSDLVDLRVAIEAMTARAAAERRAGDKLAALAAEIAGVEDRDRFLDLDTGFHVELARASGNALAPLLMEALRETIADRMRVAFRAAPDWAATRARIAADHAALAAAVAAGDADGAARTVTDHIRGFYQLLHAPAD
jgi:GntR family transcriptional regulator, transcriptional repressor for pyruvate dehydrogenase complex